MKSIVFSPGDLEQIKELMAKAREREAKEMVAELRLYCNRMETEEDVWELGRIIQYKQKEMKLRNENSNLALVLARLLAASFISENELAFLDWDARQAILVEAEMWSEN